MSGIDFRGMPPVTPERRRENAPKVKTLLNGHPFKYLFHYDEDGKTFILGECDDVTAHWTENGKFVGHPDQGYDFNWRSAREDKPDEEA